TPPLLDRVELGAQLFDLLRARAVRFLDRRGVEALTLRARDLVARRILKTLQAFELGNDPPARVLERRDVLERLVAIDAPIAQACAHGLGMIANKGGVE